MATYEQRVERWSTIAWPLAWSMAAVTLLTVLTCRFELGSTLSRWSLLLFPVVCLVGLACVHAGVLSLVRNIMDRGEPARRSLLCGLWLPIVWIPPLVVLGTDRSIWVAALAVLITAWIVVLRRGWWKGAQEEVWLEGAVQSLFVVPSHTTLGQTIFPVVLTSIAAQLGMMALVARKDWLAGGLLALASLLPVWRVPGPQAAGLHRLEHKAAGNSVLALLLMMLALVPFLKPGRGHQALEGLLEIAHAGGALSKAHLSSRALGAGYPGIILYMPLKTHETVIAPPPSPLASFNKARPVVIPFDGAYWFFKEPDTRPRPDAKVAQGDPLKTHIRSTNQLALQMEAHQVVLPAIDLSCCGTLSVDLTNAETEAGQIDVEVLLTDNEADKTLATSLGTLALTSSATSATDPQRSPLHETLTFSVPRSLRSARFSEITVRIKAAHGRERVGSRVGIDGFVLMR